MDLYVAKKAKKTPTSVPLTREAYEWLSRGLLEHLVGFIGKAADATWSLDIAIYEYELRAIREAVAQAAQRGAEIRILHHAKPGDPQTRENRFARSFGSSRTFRRRCWAGRTTTSCDSACRTRGPR